MDQLSVRNIKITNIDLPIIIQAVCCLYHYLLSFNKVLLLSFLSLRCMQQTGKKNNKVVFHSCECETCWVYARGKRMRRLREYVFCFIIYFILNRFNTKSPDSFLNGMIAQKKRSGINTLRYLFLFL